MPFIDAWQKIAVQLSCERAFESLVSLLEVQALGKIISHMHISLMHILKNMCALAVPDVLAITAVLLAEQKWNIGESLQGTNLWCCKSTFNMENSIW